MYDRSVSFGLDPFLKLVVKHQHERRSDTSPEVGQVAFKETCNSFRAQDSGSTVDSSFVHTLLFRLATLHHQSSSDGIERVGKGLGTGGDNLCEEESR